MFVRACRSLSAGGDVAHATELRLEFLSQLGARGTGRALSQSRRHDRRDGAPRETRRRRGAGDF